MLSTRLLFGYERSKVALDILLGNSRLQSISNGLVHSVDVLESGVALFRSLHVDVNQTLLLAAHMLNVMHLLVIKLARALESVELLFVIGGEGVHETVDEIAGRFDDVGVAAAADDPFPVAHDAEAEEGVSWTATGHLIDPEVGSVCEIESVLFLVGH